MPAQPAQTVTHKLIAEHLLVARSFVRIHWGTLCDFGVLPLTFADPVDQGTFGVGDTIVIDDVHAMLKRSRGVEAKLTKSERVIRLRHDLSDRQLELLRAGGIINGKRLH